MNILAVVRRLLIAFGVICVLYLGVLTAFQKNFIYFPSRAAEPALLEQAVQRGVDPWRNAQGDLIGWKTPVEAGTPPVRRLLIFHGNGGFALDRLYIAAPLPASWQAFVLEYPGYGARSGCPSEEAIRLAAVEALDSLIGPNQPPMFLAGESLGSGVASYVAAQRPRAVQGVVLITPMTSLVDVAARYYPFLPVHYMMTERYDSLTALRGYTGPVSFVLAGRDEIIPVELGRRLYESYAGPKRIWEQRKAGHNSLDFRADLWAPVFEFVVDQARMTADPSTDS